MTDRLVEIQYNDLAKLKRMYTPGDLKHYSIGYMTIENYTRWLEQNADESEHIKFFCLNGDFSDGTFVVTERLTAYADTLSDSFDKLHRLVQLLDYSKGYFFMSIRNDLGPVILDALREAKIEPIRPTTTILYYMSKEDALKFTAQRDDVELRPLSELKDLEKVDAAWPPRNPASLPFLQRCAKYNPSIGAFKKDDGTLVSWVLRLPTGLHGALQTDENYYGQGYGALVLKYNSRAIAELGHDVYAGVFEENIPSRALFSKLGFEEHSIIYWIGTPNEYKTNE